MDRLSDMTLARALLRNGLKVHLDIFKLHVEGIDAEVVRMTEELEALVQRIDTRLNEAIDTLDADTPFIEEDDDIQD